MSPHLRADHLYCLGGIRGGEFEKLRYSVVSDDSLNPERIRSALSALNPDDRRVWIRAGMCLHDWSDTEGFDIWDAWGSMGDTYSASAARSSWRSFKPGKVTINSLFFDAMAAGWKDSTKYQPPTPAEIEARKVARAQRLAAAEAEEAAMHEDASAEAQKRWNAAKEATAHPYLTRKGVLSHGLRVGRWEVTDAETGEIRVATENGLLIPLKDRTGRLWSLQCVPPEEKRNKLNLKGGAKSGNLFALGKKPLQRNGKNVFILVEGYATGASIHECSGHFVLVCFDTSNLITVARALRERQPDAIIIFGADNDSQTDGNPGVKYATAAAREVNGLVAVPPPGDFNDLHVAEGPDAVVDYLDSAAAPAPVVAPVAAPTPEPKPTPAPVSNDAPAADLEPVSAVPDDEHPDADHFDPSGCFKVLGYNRGTYYVFHHGTSQILDLTMGEIGSESTMLMLAPLEFWEMHLPSPDGKPGLNKKGFMNWFFRLAERRGIYDTSRFRGRGAWIDEGRHIYHFGSQMSVDGEVLKVTEIRSKYVYELAQSLPPPAPDMLSDSEGLELLETAKMFRWSKPGAAALLVGWTFIAPLCGAMKWRPHIWLTGGAGCGKSTILNEYVNPLMSGIAVFAQGNSTESGMRQKLKADALPVLFDESESNNDAEKKRMDGILSLIRQASTESPAQTYKGTISGDSMNFHIRSMFCLASIQVGMEHKADQDRLTKLSLMKAQDDPTAAETWAKIKERLYKISSDSTIANRNLRRSINLLPIMHQNVAVFVKVAAKKFGTQRMGDQYGTLLAACWNQYRSDVATPEQASEMIDAYEWGEFTEGGEVDDSEKALRAILESKITYKGDAISVSAMVTIAQDGIVDGLTLDAAVARRLLRDNGMNFQKGLLLFQNGSKALHKMVSDTPFAADLSGQLLRVPGAKKVAGCRFGATMARAVGIPLALVVHPNTDEPAI